MNKAITYGFGFAVLAGLFLIGSLMQSRESQAKGAYSTPVTVLNTTANPGSVLDADKATRIPYQSSVPRDCGSGLMQCSFLFSAAPSGFRLVVENVSGNFLVNGSTPPSAWLFGSTNSQWEFTSAVGQSQVSGFNQSVRAYFDPTDGQPVVGVVGNFAAGVIGSQRVTLSGYLENCAIVGCPAVQH